MTARVEASDVKAIIETSLTEVQMEAYITASNLTVTKILGTSDVLSEEQLFEIERWFTAHLIACTRERQIKSERAGDAEATYEGKTAMGLDATFYGQQVKVIDTSGLMSAQIGRQPMSVFAITGPTFDE